MKEPLNDIQGDEISVKIESFSQEEKKEILQQIDRISAGSKISITPELFEVKPAKKGWTLPLVINILGLVVIAGGFFFANRYFQAKEETMVLEEKTYVSAEDSVVKELKKQTEEKLKQKEEEISKIQSELAKLDKESASLKATMESQIKAKEDELKRQMQIEMEKERARLKSKGISSAEMEKQLKEFQNKKELDINTALESFKIQSEAALKEKEKELTQAKAVAQQILDKANKDKAALEAEAKKREEELTKQFEAEKKALTEQNLEAQKKLEELSRLQRNERLVQDQITGSYTQIMNAINEGDYAKASLAINDLRKILSDPKIQSLPNIYKRLDVENFILDSLESRIAQAGTEKTTDFKTLASIAQMLINARTNAKKGEEAAEKGDIYEARRYLNASITSLPQIKKAVDKLNEIEAKSREERARDFMVLGDASLKKGDLADALDQYRNAAVNAAVMNKEIIAASIHKFESVKDLEKENLAKKDKAAYLKLKAENSRKLEALNKALTDKDNEIKNLNSLLKTEQAKKAELEQQIDTLNKEISKLNTDLSRKDNVISEKEKEIKQLSDELTKATERIRSLMRRVSSAEQQVSKLQKELDDAVNQIVDLINQ